MHSEAKGALLPSYECMVQRKSPHLPLQSRQYCAITKIVTGDRTGDFKDPDVGRARLVLVDPNTDGESEELSTLVRSSRRDIARLLRGLQASGKGLASLPDPVTTRLAHADAVTASFLLGKNQFEEGEVRAAASSLRAVERWISERLNANERTHVKTHEMMVRIDDDDLCQPLVRTDWIDDDLDPQIQTCGDRHEEQAMRFGLSLLPELELVGVCRRLGIRIDPPPWTDRESPNDMSSQRLHAEQSILQTLLDGHLLAILIATLPGEAHRLLAGLIRGTADDNIAGLHKSRESREEPGKPKFSDNYSNGISENPIEALRGCGLAFTDRRGERLWVPIELQRRVDGVLRAFGV